MNVIDNAIKYTFSGKIDVIVEKPQLKDLREFEHYLKIQIKDTGIGIDKS